MSQVPGQGTVSEFDVIVVGASLAGCTVARLYGLAGLSVALVDHHRDAATYKQLCTHFIQASATPTLRRLGLDRLIEDAGAVRNGVDMWTRYGWTGDVAPTDAQGQPLYGYNMRRETLDPILRSLTATTPGVTPLFGGSVRGLLREQGAIAGIRIEGAREAMLRARLVVAADGRNSAMAGLAGVEPKSGDNIRFGAFRSYRQVPLRRGTCSQMWFYGSDVGYVFPNDDGVTVVAYMGTKDKLDPYRSNPARALEESLAALPDAPDLSGARPVSDPLVVKDYPNLWRPPVAHGMAFVGDALMSLDPLWGIGCGFAFQSADWLADSTVEALRDRRSLRDPLKRYARTVSRRLNGHRFLTLDFSRRKAFNPIERLMFSAAARDRDMSRHVHAFGARLIGPARFLSPLALARAGWVHLTRPAAAESVPA